MGMRPCPELGEKNLNMNRLDELEEQIETVKKELNETSGDSNPCE